MAKLYIEISIHTFDFSENRKFRNNKFHLSTLWKSSFNKGIDCMIIWVMYMSSNMDQTVLDTVVI